MKRFLTVLFLCALTTQAYADPATGNGSGAATVKVVDSAGNDASNPTTHRLQFDCFTNSGQACQGTGGGGGATAATHANCTGTSGSHNLACKTGTSASSTTVCVNNGDDTCTISSVSLWFGWHNANGSNLTADFACYDSSHITLAGSAQLFVSTTTSVIQAGAIWTGPLGGIGVATGSITCTIISTGNLGSNGVDIWYH